MVRTDHGLLPIPAPAVLELLQGAPTYSTGEAFELCTPTGAALLAEWTDTWGALPAMTLERVGYGAGSHDLDRPNVIRIVVGEATETGPATGRALLCNRPYDGMAALEDFATEHLRTGALILYTSQDSVAQLAAHTDVLAEPGLYAACAAAREVMAGEHAVSRVIARPFRGSPGAFARTEGRRDFSVAPPARSALDALRGAGVETHAVGKTHDLFAGRGFAAAHPGATNAVALQETGRLIGALEHGLVFTNLVETDQVYGHRKDIDGFHAALRAIDTAVAGWLERLGEGDLLVLTADHGCDPLSDHTDHTRECVPLLAAFAGHGGRRHDGALADVGASVVAWLTGGGDAALPGRSFVG